MHIADLSTAVAEVAIKVINASLAQKPTFSMSNARQTDRNTALSTIVHSAVNINEKNLRKNTFANVAIRIWQATRSVAKEAFVGINALVRRVRFNRTPVTIRGVIAVQPVGDIVRRCRF